MSAAEPPRKPLVIIGTSGSHDYLKDATGDRRYWEGPDMKCTCGHPHAAHEMSGPSATTACNVATCSCDQWHLDDSQLFRDDEWIQDCAVIVAATEGPWQQDQWYGTNTGGWTAIGPLHHGDDEEPDGEAYVRAIADSTFIARARSRWPIALAEVERLKEARLLDGITFAETLDAIAAERDKLCVQLREVEIATHGWVLMNARLEAERDTARTDAEVAGTRMAAALDSLAASDAQREVVRLRAEVSDLRLGIIWACDAVSRVYAEQRTIRAVRQAANRLSQPFDIGVIESTVQAEVDEVARLTALVAESRDGWNKALDNGEKQHRELVAARAERDRVLESAEAATVLREVDRLRAALVKANSNHEDFERRWYLATDALEEMTAARDRALAEAEAADIRMAGVLDATFSVGDGTAQREICRLREALEAMTTARDQACDLAEAASAAARRVRSLGLPLDVAAIEVLRKVGRAPEETK